MEGYIELIGELDDLAGDNNEHVGKIKLYTWRGHNFITDPKTDVAGVGWILAQNWMPYQRPTFVTPPFAGYVSGHSTYSRAAAKVLTLLTGDEYFPGGLGEFLAGKNNFLVFEDGPSDEVILQWAKYYDASDQCSLSRIWGGIHPPVDDIPGRLIGDKVGEKAFNLAEKYFDGEIITDLKEHLGGRDNEFKIYPNPIIKGQLTIQVKNINTQKDWSIQIMDISGRFVRTFEFNGKNATQMVLDISKLPDGYYVLGLKTQHSLKKKAFIVK